MVNTEIPAHQAPAGWNASHRAVHVERLRDADGELRVAMLRHTTYPYTETLPPMPDADLQDHLQAVAQRYLDRVAELAGIQHISRQLVEGAGREGFGWLDIGWGPGLHEDPRLSFWLNNSQLVLLAGNRVRLASGQRALGAQTGLRLDMQVLPAGGGRRQVSITDLWLSGLDRNPLPQPQRAPQPPAPRAWFDDRYRLALSLVQTHLGMQAAAFNVNGISRPADGRLLLSGTLRQGQGEAARVYAWSAVVVQEPEGGFSVLQSERVEQVTHMAPRARALRADPASRGPAASADRRRPTAHPAVLDSHRVQRVPLPVDPVNPALKSLHDPDPAGPRFQVLTSPVVDPAAAVHGVQTVPAGDLPLRSDDLSAVHAFQRGRELFTRLRLYGLNEVDYFKQVRLPLLLRHRAAFNSAPDGHTVNAQVRFVDATPDVHDPHDPQTWPQVEVGFGSANLTHRPRLPDSQGHLSAQPLGLAADQRWAWHEFGHVLLAASSGELEFRFAHSVGDALAAIVADPDSRFSTQVHAAGSRQERLRMLTFPWVRIARSHGHRAELGWCWCGRRSRRRFASVALLPKLYSDYFEEQLLSASMFTLYCALGGLPGNTPVRRHTASHYSVCLIMRALTAVGPAQVVPAATADQWVSALITADRYATPFAINPAALVPALGPLRRACGGGAHKVIRWAFENQGLYASDVSNDVVEGTGRPPRVDLYIPGLADRLQGGYEPVPLTWASDPLQPAPLWHASDAGLFARDNALWVVAGNRGAEAADDVTARCWVAAATAGALVWQELPACVPPVAPVTVRAQAMASFCFVAPAAGAYWVLAEISCEADRANLDPLAGLPCSTGGPPTDTDELTDLVSGDNNLGLRVMVL